MLILPNKQCIGDGLVNQIIDTLLEELKSDLQVFSLESFTDLETTLRSLLKILMNFARLFLQLGVSAYQDAFFENTALRNVLNLTRKNARKTRTMEFETVGAIELRDDQYKDRTTGKCCTMLNTFMGLQKRARIAPSLRMRGLQFAVDYSYRKSALLAGGFFSYGTIKNTVHSWEAPEPVLPKEKRRVRAIHVLLDEDHSHMQPDAQGKKKRTLMCPFGVIAEGRRKICEGRHELIGRHFFVDASLKAEAVLDQIKAYIYQNYDLDCLEFIYVMGDAANWITQALDDEFPGMVIHVHDAYHRFKPIGKISRLFPHSKVPERVNEALKNNDQAAFLEIVAKLMLKADAKAAKKLDEFQAYFLNHWDAIVASMNPEIMGSCTEPMVQHLLSDRFSTRPMGWSPEGLGQLAATRAYLMNGGDILNPDPSAPKRGAHLEYLRTLAASAPKDWSVFDPIAHTFDGNCGTGHRLHQTAAGGQLLG